MSGKTNVPSIFRDSKNKSEFLKWGVHTPCGGCTHLSTPPCKSISFREKKNYPTDKELNITSGMPNILLVLVVCIFSTGSSVICVDSSMCMTTKYSKLVTYVHPCTKSSLKGCKNHLSTEVDTDMHDCGLSRSTF